MVYAHFTFQTTSFSNWDMEFSKRRWVRRRERIVWEVGGWVCGCSSDAVWEVSSRRGWACNWGQMSVQMEGTFEV